MKKILFTVIVIVCLAIINDLTRSVYDIWNKKDFVSKAEQELEAQKDLNNKLKSELSYVQTPEFIEKEARNKLFMAKEGEQRVLVSKPQEELVPNAKEKEIPNWQQWWNLFFE